MKTTGLALTLALTLGVAGCSNTPKDIADADYRAYVNAFTTLDGARLFSNDIQQSMPQTLVYQLIRDHFNAPLPKGKTTKKVLFMGYDGFRADGLLNIKDNLPKDSAIMDLRQQGGLYLTYAGGFQANDQKSSTGPGWSSMLTGGWANYTGMFDNGIEKEIEAPTILTQLAEKGIKASFTASWNHHFSITYRKDIEKAIRSGFDYSNGKITANKGLIKFTSTKNDEETLDEILRQVAMPKGGKNYFDPSVLFFTLEPTDHAGHQQGFSNTIPHYVKATKQTDTYGRRILDTIKERATYDKEDWLFIITTDHGGFMKDHGGPTNYERTTWLATNKKLDPKDMSGKYMQPVYTGKHTKEEMYKKFDKELN